jgi:membrane associated rhomboid family serine protease
MAYDRNEYRMDMGVAGRVTPGIKWLIIANVAVFILQVAMRLLKRGGMESIFGLVPSATFGDLWLWQLVTYMFLHTTDWLGHLLLNMLMLWMFGTEVERAWGTRRFLFYYFLCGIGAGLVTAVFIRDSMTIGASGAIYGVMLAYGMMFPDRTVLFMFMFPMRAMSMVLLCIGIQVFSLLSLQDGVAYIAHLGGLLFGYLYLKRAWRLREFFGELRWKLRRRRFKVVERDKRHYPFH